MTLFLTYYSPTTPSAAGWSVDIGNAAVRLAGLGPIIAEAQLGAVGISSIAFDDPSANLGHAGDAILGLKQFAVTETAAPSGKRRIWTGYTGDRRYSRGQSGDDDSLRLGAARRIDVTLVDLNSFLSFRVLGVDETSAFDRPAETDVARVAALLGVDFLSTTLFDNGLVSSLNPVNMDACDYTGQRAADVLNDCSQQSGKNHFVYYDESAGEFSLFYDFNWSQVYLSDLRVSNVLADVDNSTTFAPAPDAVLTRDPSRVAAGVFLPYADGSVYRTEDDVALSTSGTYGFRDLSAPAVNVKTSALAQARADRILTENATEDETLTLTLFLPRENVNDWREGQAAYVKLSHLPGYEDFRQVRALKRSVSQARPTDQFYTVEYECTPLPGEPQSAWSRYAGGGGQYATPELEDETTPGNRLLALVISQGGIGQTTIEYPQFNDEGVGGALQTWTELGWVASKSATQFPGGSTRGVAVGMFHRVVAPGEVTVTPVVVSPGASPGKALAVFLWELPAEVTFGSVQTLGADYSGIDIPIPLVETSFGTTVLPGATATVGSAMTGALILGCIVTGAEPYGDGPVLASVEGTELENADQLRNAWADVNSHSPAWTWIAKLLAGGTIKASVSNSPGPTYPTSYNHFPVAGIAVQLNGLTDIEVPA